MLATGFKSRIIYLNPKFRTDVIVKNLENAGVIKGGHVAVHVNRFVIKGGMLLFTLTGLLLKGDMLLFTLTGLLLKGAFCCSR